MPHIKDKNIVAAEAKMEEVDLAGLKAMSISDVANLALQMEATEKALKEHAAIVKKHVHKVYGPMCAKKKQLEIEFAFLKLKLEKVKEINPAVSAVAKIINK